MYEPREWTDRAACRRTNPEVFFPISSAGAFAALQVAEAKQICGRCPVREDCLDWALRMGEAHGVWGGTTPEERRYLRRAVPPVRLRTRPWDDLPMVEPEIPA